MSLTQVLEMRDVKQAFDASFRRPDFPESIPQLLAPSRAKNASLVGIAFDYLFRFEIVEQLKNRLIKDTSQVNSPAFQISSMRETNLRIVEFMQIAEVGAFAIRNSDDISVKAKKDAKKVWDEIRKRLHPSSSGEELTLSERVGIYLQMAKFDQFYRAGYLHENLSEVDESDVEDVLSIFKQVNFSAFDATECCLLNPSPKAAELVGGTDADLVFDDLLVDLKTTINYGLSTKNLHQLFGYLVLSRLGGFANVRKCPELHRFGIYFARYDYLYTFRVEDVISEDDLKVLCKWFKKKFQGVVPNALIRPVTREITFR